MYDNYLIAHRTSALAVPAAHEQQVRPGGGQVRAAVLADGLARGTWAWRRGRVDTALFDPADATALAAGLAAESAAVADFLGAA